MEPVRTIGIVSGGGDAPGLNAVIRAVVRTAISQHGMRLSVSLDEALEKMKYVDPASEIAHAARSVGATFGDSA